LSAAKDADQQPHTRVWLGIEPGWMAPKEPGSGPDTASWSTNLVKIGTLQSDEVDTLLNEVGGLFNQAGGANEDLCGLLNASYSTSGPRPSPAEKEGV